jgi:hypothetical protein
MVKKKYYSRKVPLAAMPFFTVLPFVGAIVRGYLETSDAIVATLNLGVALCLFIYARHCVARIEGGMLRFYSGIGQAEVDRVELAAITAVERPRPWFMTIRYGEGKSLNLEADKAVVAELAKDLSIFVGKKTEAQAPKAKPSS